MAAALGVLAVVVGAALWLGSVKRVPEAGLPDSLPVEASSWGPILRPSSAFLLDTALFPLARQALAARRHHPGGGREDVFSLAGDGGLQGRVVLYRTGSEAAAVGSLYLELARRGAEAGQAVLRATAPELLPTRFGPAELAVVTFGRADEPHRCTAFRLVADEVDLRVTGWLCDPAGQAAERRALACLVDRLDLAPGSQDPALRAYFGAAERRRSPGCAAAPKPGPAGRKPG